MLKFLVIENDDSIRMNLTTSLKKDFACQILEAENGQVGSKLLDEFTPDLIFLNTSIPIMNSIEPMEIIRANSILKNIPVITMTATNDKKVVGSLAAMGISNYLFK